MKHVQLTKNYGRLGGRRCRILGHAWGNRIDGQWHTPTWWTSGTETFFLCKRCSTRYVDTLPRKQTFEALVELAQARREAK